LVVALALVGAVASDAGAGWRSADRRALEDEELVEEPYDEPAVGPPMLYRDFRDEPVRQAPAGVGTQPYWGTMRPYWNGNEPPGVIHRQPRTAPLKIERAR
jgi:hypothetical protein